MKIIKLGNYGRIAPPNGATSGVLIKSGKDNIVIDLGSGCLANLQKFVDIKDITCLIITHLHFDHCSDAFLLMYELEKLKINIDLYLPKTPIDIRAIFEKCENYVIHDLDEQCQINLNTLKIEAKTSEHTIETYAIVLKDSETVVYTSDCNNINSIRKNTLNANVVIGDAFILDKNYKTNLKHISVKMLAENVPEECVLLLTHLEVGCENETLIEALKYHKKSKLI